MNNGNNIDQTGHNDQKNICNCQVRKLCPLDGTCLKKNVTHEAEVIIAEQLKTVYIKSTIDFKKRYRGHMSSVFNRATQNATILTKYINKLKIQNREFKVKGSNIAEYTSYKASRSECGLCIKEAYYIRRTNRNIFIKKI